jgi:hypothetical protein
MCEWIPAPRQIHGAKHEPFLNRPFVVVTENRDNLKNKSFAEPPTFSADVVAVPSLRMYGWRRSNHNLAPNRTIKNLRGSVRTISLLN